MQQQSTLPLQKENGGATSVKTYSMSPINHNESVISEASQSPISFIRKVKFQPTDFKEKKHKLKVFD